MTLGVASVALPWIVEVDRSRIGLSQPDGWLTLSIGVIAAGLAWRTIKAGWIASGFLAVLMGRNILLLRDSETLAPGVGLWIGTAAFAAAAVIQIVGMIQGLRSTPGGNDS